MLHLITMSNHTKVTLDIQGLFGPTRAAKFLNISRMTLWRWVKSGKIHPIYLEEHPYFALSELLHIKESLK